MAEQALEAGEVVGVAVVAGCEGVPEHVWVAQVVGDLRAGAQPRGEVLGDVVRALGERLQVDLAAALSLAVAHSQNAQPRLLALWDELAALEVDELLAPEAGVADGSDDRKVAPALQRVMGYVPRRR